MSPAGTLLELLARIAARRGASVHVSNAELQHWPQTVVAACQSAGLILPGKPATSAVCSGCERVCCMPVEFQEDETGTTVDPPFAFVFCDKRQDIGRVEVAIATLVQWRTSGQVLGDVLAGLLGMERGAVAINDGQHWRIGQVEGKKHRSPLVLHADDPEGPTLNVAGHTVPVAEVLTISKNKLTLDVAALVKLVNNPAGREAEEAETPDAKAKRLAARVAQEKAKGTKAFLQVVADEEGFHKTRLQQILKRSAKQAGAIGAMVDALGRPISKGKGQG